MQLLCLPLRCCCLIICVWLVFSLAPVSTINELAPFFLFLHPRLFLTVGFHLSKPGTSAPGEDGGSSSRGAAEVLLVLRCLLCPPGAIVCGSPSCCNASNTPTTAVTRSKTSSRPAGCYCCYNNALKNKRAAFRWLCFLLCKCEEMNCATHSTLRCRQGC